MMRVDLLDLRSQYATIREQTRAAIDRVCDAQAFILGPEVAAFEREVADFCGVEHAVGVSSGTDALLAALMAVGVGRDDEVITTPYSFFATAGVIARLGARAVFVDIDPETFNLDASAVADHLSRRTKAIIPVHLFGGCAEMAPIVELSREHGISVVEDAAQAIGAFDEDGRRAGTSGDLGCFSFFPSKNLGAFGDAGMVVTNDAGLAEKLRQLRVHGSKPKYFHRIVGGNFRLDALQAAVLRVKLPWLPGWTEARRRNAALYRQLFAESGLSDVVRLPQDRPGHIYNQFVVRVPERDSVKDFLATRGVATEVYYPLPLHLQECFTDWRYRRGDFPIAEQAAAETLALPIYPELTAAQQAHVVDSLRDSIHSQEAAGTALTGAPQAIEA